MLNVICKNFGLFCDENNVNEKCKKHFRQTNLKFLWHSVEMHFYEEYFTTAVKKRENSLLHFFNKYFVKSTLVTSIVVRPLLSRNFC